MTETSFFLLYVPYYAASRLPWWASAPLLVGAFLGSLAFAPAENRLLRWVRRSALAMTAYLLALLAVAIPFNRASEEYAAWAARRGRITPGMSDVEIENKLRRYSRFTSEREGAWVYYTIEPGGLAGRNPFRLEADSDLFFLHVRYDADQMAIT